MLETSSDYLPTIYPKGTKSHSAITGIVLQCETVNSMTGKKSKETLSFDDVKSQEFNLNIGNTHVVEAIGKRHGSKVHFRVTSEEPYGVCCLAGAKVSMGMHKFGNPRWGHGLVDDIRSAQDLNTRVVGDFTKNVNTARIADNMYETISSNEWKLHIEHLVEESTFEELLKE